MVTVTGCPPLFSFFKFFCVIISLRSYFYLVVAWKFREVLGLRVKPTAFDLDIGAINVV